MNATLEILLNRKSVRSYEKRPIPEEVKNEILRAAMRAPTAGNMMLYSIIHVRDLKARQTLAITCDNQPFIAEAPLVLLFLADYQKWFDYFQLSRTRGEAILRPEEADLFLACCDALIAAQTAVIAAESLGIGSCYIGDIMENYEVHRDLFLLPRYAFPICLLCFGYATKQQLERPLTARFGGEYVVFDDQYRLLQADDFRKMFEEDKPGGSLGNLGRLMYLRKFSAGFSKEMRRSVRVILERWLAKNVELE